MKIAIIGVTGLVGQKMLEVLSEIELPQFELIPVASEKSVGKEITFKNKIYTVKSVEQAIEEIPDIALFSAGGSTSLKYAEKFAEKGTFVIDNSSAWRTDKFKRLIVPEINGDILTYEDKIIANPNCSTIQMVLTLNPLHRKYKIKRIVVSTYQSVSGAGIRGINQLNNERNGLKAEMKFPYRIDKNCIPQIDVFEENGYTKEENKMVNETKKILGDESIQVTATTVRIPVIAGHSEAVNIEFCEDYKIEDIFEILRHTKGVVVQDDITKNIYPMPILAENKDEVFVGRIRRDFSNPNSLNMWIVSDNVRKGAATNAVQIAELLIKKGFVK
jgi:aspartate-semialdehyde dehydrogenase